MAEFKCESGKVLDNDEVAKMLSYDAVGVARPEAYNDVVFDATGISGANYRCKTTDERKADEAAHKADLERSQRATNLLAEAEQYKAKKAAAGGDIATSAVNTGTRAVEGNTSVDAGADDGANTGSRAGAGTGTRRG
jgi:hypothetical protein